MQYVEEIPGREPAGRRASFRTQPLRRAPGSMGEPGGSMRDDSVASHREQNGGFYDVHQHQQHR